MEVWFDRETLRFIALAVVLVGAGLGGLIHLAAERGLFRPVMILVTVLAGIAGLAAMGLGLYAAEIGQPEHVQRALLLMGAVVAAVYWANLPDTLALYRKRESDRAIAQDL